MPARDPGGVGAVGRGLEPVQGGLSPLFAGVVTTCGSSIAGPDQVGALTGAEVTVAATPVPIDPSAAPIEGGILDRNLPSPLTRTFHQRCGDIIGALFAAAAVEPELTAAVTEARRRDGEGARIAVARIAELGSSYQLSLQDAESLLTDTLGRPVLAPGPSPVVVTLIAWLPIGRTVRLGHLADA